MVANISDGSQQLCLFCPERAFRLPSVSINLICLSHLDSVLKRYVIPQGGGNDKPMLIRALAPVLKDQKRQPLLYRARLDSSA
jgi:hypothetical protein